jgi:hypothetical protein
MKRNITFTALEKAPELTSRKRSTNWIFAILALGVPVLLAAVLSACGSDRVLPTNTAVTVAPVAASFEWRSVTDPQTERSYRCLFVTNRVNVQYNSNVNTGPTWCDRTENP